MVKIPGGLTSVECIHLQHKYVLVVSDCSHNAHRVHFRAIIKYFYSSLQAALPLSLPLLSFPPPPTAGRLMQWLIA